jgi:alkylation response protein AidB-like acyl-CoA dehydrogenase
MELFSRRNLNFTLFEVLDAESLTKYDYFNAHDLETFGMTLDSATEIAEKIMLPHYVDSDRNQPELVDGVVKVHQGVHQYFTAFAESGLLASTFPFEYDGQQLPKTIFAGVDFITGSAHNSFVMFADLLTGCANLIVKFGTDKQKQTFLPNLLSGKWGGTMCLTEPQAGSSLSDITSMAYPQADGTYKIKGQKVFISAGDQDITDNILHLLLARIEGAAQGTKGISLFVVPKNKIGSSGSNDVISMGIYHKMGQKATPAMHLGFGDNDNCTGYLLGEANSGLGQMFQMMNGARLGVGLGGIQIASAAYYASLQYAKERVQGRSLTTNQPTAIVNHPDVRRMLLTQKAIVEGTLSFILQCYKYLDLLKVCETPEEKQKYDALLELLTPVAKTYGAEMGNYSVNLGLQVLGGYGYTEDFVLEQMARDVRIMSIYEGTTGIQSLALLGRQTTRNNGVALIFWKNEVYNEIIVADTFEELKPYSNLLSAELKRFEAVTQHLLNIASKGNLAVFLADATLYMEYFGILNVAWQWLRMARVAQRKANHSDKTDDEFYKSKIHTMQFYFKYELPKCNYLTDVLMNETALTIETTQF